MIADPRHRQVREHAVRAVETVETRAAARRDNESVVRLAHAFRLAGGAGGIKHDADVVGAALRYLIIKVVRLRGVERASRLYERVVTFESRFAIIAHAARVVVNDVLEQRAARQNFQQLVDLFLVFDDRKARSCVVENVNHFVGDRVLIQRYRNPAE